MDGLERQLELLDLSADFSNNWDHGKIVDLGICDTLLAHEHRIV